MVGYFLITVINCQFLFGTINDTISQKLMYCVYVSAAWGKKGFFSLLRVFHDFEIVAHNYKILSNIINYEKLNMS